MSRTAAAVTSLLLVTSLFAMAVPGSAAIAATDGSTDDGYAGSHVAFDVEGDAITDFTVGGSETFSEVRVQSQSEAGVGAGVGLGAVVDIDGAGLSTSAQTETSATIAAESGAELSAHDTERGHLVVAAGDEAQFVEAELASGASAEADGEAVVVTDGEREGAFVVVGEGEVAVNDEGDVAADLAADAELVFRSYADGERDDEAKAEEAMLAEGAASVELHVEERDGETVSEAVSFGAETAAEAGAEAENEVEMTVERTVSEGTIVLATVSESAVGSIEDLEVTVDGEVAAEASSASELEAAADGEEPRYLIASQNEAEGEASVYVAIDHFSERTVAMSGDDGSADDASDDGSTDEASDDAGVDDALPGFGALAAVIAALLAVGARVR